MNALTDALAAMLRWMIRALPAGRRDWGEAAWSETADVPAGWPRVRWLLGSIAMLAPELGFARRAGYTVAAGVAGTVLVWLGWHPGSENPAMPTDRTFLVLLMVSLAGLPWVARPWLGPVAANATAQAVRSAGYLSLYALLTTMMFLSRFAASRFDHFQAFNQENWEADMRSEAVVGGVIVVALLMAYAFAILAITSERLSAPRGTLLTGVGAGIGIAVFGYAFMPLGTPIGVGRSGLVVTAVLVVPAAVVLVAGFVVGTRTARAADLDGPGGDRPVPTPGGQGTLAGLSAGGTAAILLAIVTITTMLLFPRSVQLEWGNPDPDVPHGTLDEVQMSVGDTALKYEFALLLAPLAGLVLSGLGGAAARAEPIVGAPVMAGTAAPSAPPAAGRARTSQRRKRQYKYR